MYTLKSNNVTHELLEKNDIGLVDERVEAVIDQLQDKYNTTLEKLDKEQKTQATQISNNNDQLLTINNEITSLKKLIGTMQSSIKNNLTQINVIKEDITSVNNEITSSKKLCDTMQSSIKNNLTQINVTKQDITTVKNDIMNIKKGATPVASEGGI